MASAGGARRLVRSHLAPLTIVVVLAIAGDIAQWLRAAPMWVDEEMIAINFRDRSFVDLAGPLWLGQAAPLGWLFAQRTAVLAAGSSELVLRFIPFLAGVALLVTAAWIGRRWFTLPASVLLVLLCWIGQWLSHYRFELKHYSADAFAGLLLPALAAWAAESGDTTQGRIRWTRWWLTAALAQWIAYGAIFVVPACALLLGAAILVRHGLRSALYFAAAGSIWLLSFLAHYLLSLQYTDRSRHLREYWSGDVVPTEVGLMQQLSWLAERFEKLAENPIGVESALMLWVAALCGFVFGRSRVLMLMFAAVPVSGFLLAAWGRVPLSDRLALWLVPALYVGIAALFDFALRAVTMYRFRGWRTLVPAAAGLAVAFLPAFDIAKVGRRNLEVGVPGDSNHGLDDRSAVSWLMERRQPGDVILTTRLGWPAIWWYGGISLASSATGRLSDGSMMYEVSVQARGPACAEHLPGILEGRRRVLVQIGFPDAPEWFYERLIGELAGFGEVVESATFATYSRAALVELRRAAAPFPPGGAGDTPLDACIGVRTARRW